MKETISEIVAAGAFLLAPHHAEQHALADPTPQIQMVVDSENVESAPVAQSENHEPLGPLPIDSIPVQTVAFESLDPNMLSTWLEVGAASLGFAGVSGGFITSRKLKKSLRRNHTNIKNNGWEAQTQLSNVLDAAKQQAVVLNEDDVPKLRELIAEYDQTPGELLDALASSNAEFDAERKRLFPRKQRLNVAPDTKRVMQTTKAATGYAKALQDELNRVQTALNEIDGNIDSADTIVAALRANLAALTQKGWNVSAYEQRVTDLLHAIASARAKRAENYIDGPVKIAEDTTRAALKLQEKANRLESRRVAADEACATQPDRIAAATATAEAIRGRFAALQDTYNPSCLVDFENVPDELNQALTKLVSTGEAAAGLTGAQGMSVEAVKQSEELNAIFDASIKRIKSMEQDLQKREEHLLVLSVQLPRKVSKLSARFDRAMELVGDPDVEGDTADSIQALADDIARLSASIRTTEGQRPDYLGIEKSHQDLAEEVHAVHRAATQEKQEMQTLRTNIPELSAGYNDLVEAIRERTKGVELYDETWDDIRRLDKYELTMATDRESLRKQQKYLKKRLKNARALMGRIETEAAENDADNPLAEIAEILGVTALIELLDD